MYKVSMPKTPHNIDSYGLMKEDDSHWWVKIQELIKSMYMVSYCAHCCMVVTSLLYMGSYMLCLTTCV